MQIYKTTDYHDMSRKAANIISAQIILKPNSVLGLATGSTVLGIYNQLVEWYHKGDLDFSRISTVNLDEYKGLAPDNHQSYRYYMDQNLFHQININKENTHLPNGQAGNVDEECARFNDIIEHLGGIDLQLLGLGRNGHIGFNEPSEVFEKGTHCVRLTGSTREANSRLFDRGETVPEYAYTMGIRTILLAKKIVLAVSGEDKAEILKEALYGPVSPAVPASILQLHPDLIVVADAAAANSICFSGEECV